MTDLLFPVAPIGSIAVLGEAAEFPINRIFCVGRNYPAHAEEMGVAVDREAPFYFTKSSLAFEPSGVKVPYPPGTTDYHFEMELVVAIGAAAFNIGLGEAKNAVYGYACGLDMTRRDLQLMARAKGRPWDTGKDFEQSAVIGPITKASEFGGVENQMIKLEVNGVQRQESSLTDLVWSVDELVSDLSKYYHLVPGDVILTGTPAGVGAVGPGDELIGSVDGLTSVLLTVGAAHD